MNLEKDFDSFVQISKAPHVVGRLVLKKMGVVKQKFSIVNITMVEGTKNNSKVMVANIDKIQLTKLEVEDHWSQAQEKWQMQQREYLKA